MTSFNSKLIPASRLVITAGLLLAIVPSACSQKKTPAPAPDPAETASFEPFPQDQGKLELDHWYSVHLQDQPAGSLHVSVTLHDTPRGLRRIIKVEEEVTLRRGAEEVRTSSIERALEDDRGHLLRVKYSESEAGGDPVVVQAGKSGPEMIILRGPEIIRRPFEESALGALRPHEWVLKGQDLKSGDEFNFRTFMRLSAGYCNNLLKVIRVPGHAGYIEVEQTSEAMPGVIQRVKLDRQFNPLEIESSLGALRLSFKRVESRPTS